MIEAQLGGPKYASKEVTFSRFPVLIGRNPSADLVLDDQGVWDRHLQIDFKPPDGFLITTTPPALAVLNGQPLSTAILKNGDRVQAGSVIIQFWLSPLRQRSLAIRELLTWAALVAASLLQVYLIYWLIHLTS